MYRAKPVTQRDGSPLQFSNCLMATAAVGLDFHTLGGKTSTGGKMRAFSGDTAGGTNTDEIERAWYRGYQEDPVTRDGQPWDKVLSDLWAGRLVMLQVWMATVGGACMSGSGYYGHGIAVAPESRLASDGSREWLVADPWCKPPKWQWLPQSKLRAGAEKWVTKVESGATGPFAGARIEDMPRRVLQAIIERLLSQWTAEHPAPEEPPDGAAGSVGVLFASTRSQKEEAQTDVALQVPDSLHSIYTLTLPKGTPYYGDAGLTDKYSETTREYVLPYVGFVPGGKARAVVLTTGGPYSDGEKKPSIVYVPMDTGEPEKAWE
jgi:hypothetical protein